MGKKPGKGKGLNSSALYDQSSCQFKNPTNAKYLDQIESCRNCDLNKTCSGVISLKEKINFSIAENAKIEMTNFLTSIGR